MDRVRRRDARKHWRLPVPGETVLITAALIVGATHQFTILEVIAVAAIAGVIGDNVGFFIGRSIGLRLLGQIGHYVRLTEGRLILGRYLFMRHGGKIVFFGRFVALLRTFSLRSSPVPIRCTGKDLS